MNNNNKQRRPNPLNIGVIILGILLVVGVWLAVSTPWGNGSKSITYKEIIEVLHDGNNKTRFDNVTMVPANGSANANLVEITGTYYYVQDGNEKSSKFESVITRENWNTIQTETEMGKTTIAERSSFSVGSLILNILPYVLFIGLFFFLIRGAGQQNSSAFDFAKSTAKLSRGKTVTFNEVAGCDEEKEELVEIVDFLKNPKKYVEIGARIPKGVLLSGNPGTGKTLLAKAVAGEAGVPFFSISGSDFVEMFVGVGASRVRDMFKNAKQNAPCIVFIDEIDAVGRQRGSGIGGGHDEREQTLNQLLVEMDGFNPNSGIIVMAATNRVDVLDPALLRPGRFDRQIIVPNPDVRGREAILKVHARNKKFDESVNFEEIAHRIPGFSGADIENLLNEAALLAARENRKVINKFDIDEATDRVMMGPAKKSRRMTEKEKNTVAHHEAGHAVIGLKLEHSNVVQKVTIVPRGEAGGYALMLPEEETYLQTKTDLLDRITGYLGGRVAEEIMFNEVSTGASADFQSATRIARKMVTVYGMSNLGPVQYEAPNNSVFLGRDYLKEKDFSDQIALEIDKETRRIIEECYENARKCILENLDLLKTIASYLKKIETLTKSDIDEIEKTGHIKWYDDKEKAKAEEALKEKEAKELNAHENKEDTPLNQEESSLDDNLKEPNKDDENR
jgi:cell division protease FtsH